MTSIRKKLIFLILAVIFAVTVLLATVTYFSVREEMDEFYDENLKQVAHTILSTGPSGNIEPAGHRGIGTKLRGEEKYLTQIYKNDVLVYSSYPNVEFPLQAHTGKGRAKFNNSTWRYYKGTNGGVSVQLAQDLKERHSVVLEIYGFLLIPIILQFPILAGLIWMMIGYGLKPLHDISNLIKNRNPNFLEALPDGDIPVEINTLVHALNELLSRLEQALESQRRFTADAAHELRTPLTAVRLQLDILKRADDEEEKKAALETLEKGVRRSTHLVQQLLELARQEPENIEVEFSGVDLAKVVEEVIEQTIPISHAKNISVKFHAGNRPIIQANAHKLALMIGNLLSNAVTYTKEGGHVDIKLWADQDKIILDVADDGIGINPQDHERIFDRFFRVAGTGTTGSGLGLSIVRNIADLHKASINISKGIGGKGSCFQVRFQKA